MTHLRYSGHFGIELGARVVKEKNFISRLHTPLRIETWMPFMAADVVIYSFCSAVLDGGCSIHCSPKRPEPAALLIGYGNLFLLPPWSDSFSLPLWLSSTSKGIKRRAQHDVVIPLSDETSNEEKKKKWKTWFLSSIIYLFFCIESTLPNFNWRHTVFFFFFPFWNDLQVPDGSETGVICWWIRWRQNWNIEHKVIWTGRQIT